MSEPVIIPRIPRHNFGLRSPEPQRQTQRQPQNKSSYDMNKMKSAVKPLQKENNVKSEGRPSKKLNPGETSELPETLEPSPEDLIYNKITKKTVLVVLFAVVVIILILVILWLLFGKNSKNEKKPQTQSFTGAPPHKTIALKVFKSFTL